MKLFRSTPVPVTYAPGFPATDVVVAKRLRRRGDFLRATGPIVLVNDTNAFTIDPSRFSVFTVSSTADDDGAYALQGLVRGSTCYVGDLSNLVDLGTFGSLQAAKNAYSCFMKAYVGATGPSWSGSFWFYSAVKVFGVLAVLLVITILVALLSPVSGSNVEPGVSSSPTPSAQGQSRNAFNPAEINLDDIVAGKYEFNPQLKAPDVEMPKLNCAPK